MRSDEAYFKNSGSVRNFDYNDTPSTLEHVPHGFLGTHGSRPNAALTI